MRLPERIPKLIGSFLTNVIVGLIVFLTLVVLSEFPPIKNLEGLGEDLAMRRYAQDVQPVDRPPVALVLIDERTQDAWTEGNGTIGQRLVDLVRLIRHDQDSQKPRPVVAVILDLEIGENVAEEYQQRLEQELRTEGPRVVLPLQQVQPTLGESGWEAMSDRFDRDGLDQVPHLVRGIALLAHDSDGVVRSSLGEVCVLRHLPAPNDPRKEVIAWTWVPTLARAAKPSVLDQQKERECTPGERTMPQPILFRTVASGQPGALKFEELSAVELIGGDGKEAKAAKEMLPFLAGAYVVIGQTHRATWTDQHVTPVGPMPGVLVHANALRSVLKGEPHRVFVYLYEVVAFIIGGFWFALMSTTVNLPIYKYGLGPHLTFVFQFGTLAFAFAFAAFGLTFSWTWVAGTALHNGVVAGTLVPLLALGLETLLEAGEILITEINEILECSYRKIKECLRVLVCLLTVSAATWAGSSTSTVAQDIVGTLTVGTQSDQANVEILRHHERSTIVGVTTELWPLDTILIRSRINVVLRLNGCQPELLHGPNTYVAPARTPSLPDGLCSDWNRLFQGPVVVPGVTVVRRGVDDETSDILSTIAESDQIGRPLPNNGPLRALPAFAEAKFLSTKGRGLALAWAGGAPPYETVVETPDGKPLIAFSAPIPFVWQPDWQMPDTGVRLRIYDANDRVIRADLRPASDVPAMESNDPVVGPVIMFQKQPAWRYEALRYLAIRGAVDPLAAQVVLTIRASK